MLAFLRVMLFYLGFAALLIWGMFALGLADALELPGFEGARAPVATTPMPVANRPVTDVARSQDSRLQDPKPERPVETRREPVPEPPPPPVVAPVAPPARSEVVAAAPVVERPRTVEPPKVAASAPPPPQPPPPPVAPRIETKGPDPIARPASPASPVPPRQTVSPPPVVIAPAAAKPPRVADVAPVKPPPAAAPQPPPQTRAPAPAATAPTAWAAVHRIAGFGAAGLAERLADKRRARDDIACVMFRNIVFKGGTTIYRPSARTDLEQVAKVLKDHPGQRVELGSRLGPGRPMVTDAKLRTDRAALVRDSLISLGVAPARLAIDTREAYERVAEDVGRIDGGRVQSMGVCIVTL